ncbi:MAG TPA: cysteine desulfurase [Phycisphaerales bacterium]|nr:cysteine desulfurase [Phycisphaerales bacterium]
MIYLDNNATTRPSSAARDAMLSAIDELWHNPSSMHRPGQAVRRRVELARASVARLINASPKEIVFCSCGTCSIHTAIGGVFAARDDVAAPNLITTPIEHSAIKAISNKLEKQRGVETKLVPLTPGGVIDLDALEKLIDDNTVLVSIQWANNETGVIQPIEQIGRLCKERGVLLHVDGVQWVGKMPTNVGTGSEEPTGPAHDDAAGAWIDMLSFSAHKFHGPKGVGGLWIRRGTRIAPVSPGSQEQGRRGGTENVPGILGMAAAAEECLEFLDDPAQRPEAARRRDRFERAILDRVPGSHINGPSDPALRVWNTTNIAFPRLEAEIVLLMLSERGVCASAGSACSSGSLEPSPVLLAMGVDPASAHGSVRFSICRETTAEELDQAIEAVVGCVQQLSGTISG